MSELISFADESFTNLSTVVIFPPGSEVLNELGVVAFSDSFETNVLSLLVPTSLEGIPLFPIHVGETNMVPTTRFWMNAGGAVFTNTAVPPEYERSSWVTNNYEVPDYLEGQDRQNWIEDLTLNRQLLSFELISTNDLPAYWAMLTNSLTQLPSSLGSNDIGALKLEVTEDGAAMDIYMQAPAYVDYVGIYETDDLINPFP
ncbi:MAG: hypothetical protein GY703_01380 [Gammaproteobacteria bacterium]|nr:hypothetical protein [Gammaproteobacteria bacterium]